MAALTAQAGEKKSQPGPYALIAGTVFYESGLSLPDATVTLVPDPQAGNAAPKPKKQQSISDRRGEFVFRVPAAAMRYTVRVAAKDCISQEKSVHIEGEGRVEVTFQLAPESK